MTDYGHNFDPIGQKLAFESDIHKFLTELESRHEKAFKTFNEYSNWHSSIIAKYSHIFDTAHRQQFLLAHAS